MSLEGTKSLKKKQFTIIFTNLDTWIKDILQGTLVGGTLTKFSQEIILKIYTEVVRKLEDFTAEEKHRFDLIKLLLDETVRFICLD